MSSSPLRSHPDGIIAPALLSPHGARLHSVLWQLEQSQWWSADRHLTSQYRQAARLLDHAWHQSPAYRLRLDAAGYTPGTLPDPALWQRIAPLTRAELQQDPASLCCGSVPAGHGTILELQSSGSTGSPVRVRRTELSQFFWQAITLRDHLWQDRDVSLPLAAIRPDRLEGGDLQRLSGWGMPVDSLYHSGPSLIISSSLDICRQLDHLRELAPGYLITLPTNLRALVLASDTPPSPCLRDVKTFGETVTPELRELVRKRWGVPLMDLYSATETGYLALQCPHGGQYHIQSEVVMVEVLDDAGRPCPPGDIGRVVVTPLHEFAQPLIRYELGDYAEVGEPCPCGRGLPVLRRILGRSRNMAVTPEGRRFWPSFPAELWTAVAPIRQLQLLQRTPDAITVRYAMERPLSEEEMERLREKLGDSLRYRFRIDFEHHGALPRRPSGKYEDFISELRPEQVVDSQVVEQGGTGGNEQQR